MRPDFILWRQTSFSEDRLYSVRPDLLLWGQAWFCETRPHSVRSGLILWGQDLFCEAWLKSVRPDLIWRGQTSFCEARPDCRRFSKFWPRKSGWALERRSRVRALYDSLAYGTVCSLGNIWCCIVPSEHTLLCVPLLWLGNYTYPGKYSWLVRWKS